MAYILRVYIPVLVRGNYLEYCNYKKACRLGISYSVAAWAVSFLQNMYTLARMLQLSGLLALLLTLRVNCTEVNEEATDLAPHVFVSVLITNSLHLMPNFFGYLEGLDYPKDRISIW